MSEKPKWVLWSIAASAVAMIVLFIRRYFFRDVHGIKAAKDQHKDLTKRAIEHFRKGTGLDAKFKVIWTDTICTFDNPRVAKGRTAVMKWWPIGKDKDGNLEKTYGPVKDGMELRCHSGLTMGGGSHVYVAWRGSLKRSAFFHELAHIHQDHDGGHVEIDGEVKYNDEEWYEKWQAVADAFEE